MDTIKKVANAILDAGEGCQSGLVYVDPVEAAKAAIAVLSTDAEPVAWGNFKDDGTLVGLAEEKNENWIGAKPLYVAPPSPPLAVKVLEPFANKANWLRAGHRPEVPGPTEVVWAFSENGYTTDGEPWERIRAALSAQVQDVPGLRRKIETALEGWSIYDGSVECFNQCVDDLVEALSAAYAAKLE